MSQHGNSLWSPEPFHILTTMGIEMISCSWRSETHWTLNLRCSRCYRILFVVCFDPLLDPLQQLNGSAQLNNAVQLIPLNMNRLGASRRCITAGWGDIGDNSTVANTLQEVNVTTLAQRVCRGRWARGRVPIARTMVCGVGSAAVQGFCSVKTAHLINPRFLFFLWSIWKIFLRWKYLYGISYSYS